MGNGNNYVLAMYDVRAKQNYIYRTKKLKEIQGASWIIRDVFDDYLFWAARVVGNKDNKECSFSSGQIPIEDEALYSYKLKETEKNNNDNAPEEFKYDELFCKREFSNGRRSTDAESGKDHYLGEVIYDGGGNFLVMFKNEQTCKDITYEFTNKLLKERPGLNVMCTYVTAQNGEKYNSEDKSGDYQRLYAKHRINENQESTIPAWGSMPFVQADYISSMPLAKSIPEGVDRGNKITSEAYAKYKKFFEVSKKEKIDEKILDKLVEEKGKESLLAVIYIDGNNMGAKVQNLLSGKETYNDCVNRLRNFSDKIQKVCVDDRKEEIDVKLKELLKLNNKEDAKNRRLVVGAGDEITIICNARYALEVAKMYLDNIAAAEVGIGDIEKITSCAGIAIFRSHTPFADAYRIAEECCENGKKKMKKLNLSEACFLDFHYCQGAIGISLDEMRKKDETENFSLPWVMGTIEGDHKGLSHVEDIKELQSDLNKIGRSNVKGLAEKAKEGLLPLEMEIKRILAHTKENEIKILNRFVNTKDNKMYSKEEKEKYRTLIYDMVLVYDLWFAGTESEVIESERV